MIIIDVFFVVDKSNAPRKNEYLLFNEVHQITS